MFKNVFMLIAVVAFFFAFEENATSPSITKTKTTGDFPRYDPVAFGQKILSRDGGENECQCSTQTCSAKTVCQSGQSCTCTCFQNSFGSTCTCTDCTSGTSTHDLWLTTPQYELWEEFYEILEGCATPAGATSRGYVEDYMDAITNDDPSDLVTAHSALIASLPYLDSTTKTAINAFYVAHDFEDDPL